VLSPETAYWRAERSSDVITATASGSPASPHGRMHRLLGERGERSNASALVKSANTSGAATIEKPMQQQRQERLRIREAHRAFIIE
jgi:hypothetical protein